MEEAWKRGERFDGWSEYFNFERWMGVFNDLGIDPDSYACRERGIDEILPWDHIDPGVSRSFLLEERHRSLAGDVTRDCRESCNACGWQGRTSVKGCSNG